MRGKSLSPLDQTYTMHDDVLWAPWRLAYVQGKAAAKAPPEPAIWPDGADRGCFLCRGAAATAHDRELLVLERTGSSLVMLNRFPYANGHLLVAPLDHRAGLAELTDAQAIDIQRTIARWLAAMERSMEAQGFNVGLNLGRVAGAGVPGHLHWHVVPRWAGDVNFMPVTAGVKVLPQALDDLWEQLHAAGRLEGA